MSENGDVLLFDRFVHLAETRTNKNIQNWGKKKSSIVANIDHFYAQSCLNVNNGLPETVLAPLKQYHTMVRDGIELLFSTICATHRNDIKAIQVATGRLAEDAKAHYGTKFQRSSHSQTLRHQMNMLFDADNPGQDPSSTKPEAAGIEEGRTKTNRSSPSSAGLSFEKAHTHDLLGKKQNRVTPPRPTPTIRWNSRNPVTNQARDSSIVRSSLSRTDSFSESPTPVASVPNPRSRRSSGSSSQSRESLFSMGASNSPSMGSSWLSMGSSYQRKKSPAASRRVPANPEGSLNPHPLTFSGLLNQGEVLENKEFEDIHPMMGDLFQYGTLLNLEYEEGLTTIDLEEPGWETEDEDGEGEGKEEEWGEDQLSQQVEDLRSKLNRKKNLLAKAKTEIFEIRRQKDEIWTACQYLVEAKEKSTEPNETAEESAPSAVDITTTSFSPTTQFGNQNETLEPDSTVALPSMRDRFANLLDSHRQRLEIAITRCDDEQIDCNSKLLNARSDLDPRFWAILDRWVNTLTAHRNDFSLTVEFFNGVMKDIRANPGSLNLADEIGDTPLTMSIPSTSSKVPSSEISNRSSQPTRPGRMRSKSEVLLPRNLMKVAIPSLVSRAETFRSRFKSVGSSIAEDLELDNASNSKDDITESQDTPTPAVIQSDCSKSVANSKAGDPLVEMGRSPDSPKKPGYSEEDNSSKRASPKKSGSHRNEGIPENNSFPKTGGLPKKSYSPEEEDYPKGEGSQNVSPEKSESPTKDSPTNDSSKNEGSPKKSDSPKKEDSSKEGDSQEKENSSEDRDILEKDESSEKDNAFDSNPSKTNNLSTPARGEGDDVPYYPKGDPTPTTDQLVNLFKWLCFKLWILLLNIVLYLASQFGAWVRFFKFVYQIVAYPFRIANGSTTTFNSPRAEDVWFIVNHVLFAMTLHVYLDVRRERNQWYDANGITRNIMLARIANPPSWSSFLGVDKVLKLGGYCIYALWLPFHKFPVLLMSIPLVLWNIVDYMLHLFGVYQLPRFFRDLLWLLYEVKDFLYCCYLGITGDDGAGYCFSSLQSPGFKGILEEYRRLSNFF
ncbi:uncharacterized protein FTOL_10171 [Fusarium torulosum]|uniref:Uncharacterized protein n=1 Tax=Fusarium torulosum TaxID=33205 RepID=A0AAE8MFS8_9HYPO|nr:uncharacterized protein FTOL_10171 [Fusarium torulosum]